MSISKFLKIFIHLINCQEWDWTFITITAAFVILKLKQQIIYFSTVYTLWWSGRICRTGWPPKSVVFGIISDDIKSWYWATWLTLVKSFIHVSKCRKTKPVFSIFKRDLVDNHVSASRLMKRKHAKSNSEQLKTLPYLFMVYLFIYLFIIFIWFIWNKIKIKKNTLLFLLFAILRHLIYLI